MSFISKVFGLLKKTAGDALSVGEVGVALLGKITDVAVFFNGMDGTSDDRRTAIDSFWNAFDARTGFEGPVIQDIPPHESEAMFDGMRATGRVLSYWAAGLYGPKPDAAKVSWAASELSKTILRITPPPDGGWEPDVVMVNREANESTDSTELPASGEEGTTELNKLKWEEISNLRDKVAFERKSALREVAQRELVILLADVVLASR